MSNEELVKAVLITRIREEIGWLEVMKHSWDPRRSIENMIVRCEEELKMLAEAGDDNRE